MVRKKRGGKGKGNQIGEASGAGMPRLAPPMPRLAPPIPPMPRFAPPMTEPVHVPRPWPPPVCVAEPRSRSGSGYDAGVKVDYSKIEFVMRGARLDDIEHNGLWLNRNECYRVYLENDEFVAKQLCESQLSNDILFPYAMHRCGSRIYNISNLLAVDVNLIPDSLPLQGEPIHCHNGISWFDLNDNEIPKKWHSAPSLELYKMPLEFAVLHNKIFCFKPPNTEKPRVHDTILDSPQVYMRQIPKHLSKISNYGVTGKIIPDPKNDRVLVHVSDTVMGSSIVYAWHPSTNHWDSITTEVDATTWKDGSPILVDDVLYFYTYHHPPYFSAFDLASKRWLKVEWTSRCPPSDARVETHTLFYLGNGLVCLPASHPIFIDGAFINQLVYEWGICVHLPIFHFRIDSTPIDGPVVIFTHLFTKLLEMEHLIDAVEFLPLL